MEGKEESRRKIVSIFPLDPSLGLFYTYFTHKNIEKSLTYTRHYKEGSHGKKDNQTEQKGKYFYYF